MLFHLVSHSNLLKVLETRSALRMFCSFAECENVPPEIAMWCGVPPLNVTGDVL